MGEAKAIVYCAIPGLVVLGSVKNEAKQAMKSKPVCSNPLYPVHQLLASDPCPFQILSQLPLMTDEKVLAK